MANRYTRKLKPDLLDEAALLEHFNQLFDWISKSAKTHMSETHQWTVAECQSEEGLEIECSYGDFQGSIVLNHGTDLNSVVGQGMVRAHYVLISATCKDQRKVDALIAENKVVDGFEKTFSYIGSGVLGVLGLFMQIVYFRIIAWEFTVGFFVGGFFLGGLLGYLMGDRIAAFCGRNANAKTFEDHVDLGVARADWREFIDSIIDPVNEFAEASESVSSIATII